jgi:hypothetical protein
MKFNTLYFLTIVYSVLFVASEPICEDENGNLIPCQKVVEKLDDFKLESSGKQKRDYYSDWYNNWLWNPWNWWYNSRDSAVGTGRTNNNQANGRANNNNQTNGRTNGNNQTNGRTNSNSQTNKGTNANNNNNQATTANKPATSTTSSSSNGLDKKPFSMTLFRNCNADQAEKVRKTIDDIITYRAAGLKVAKDTSDPQSKQIFLKYFKNESVRNQVVRTLENVNNMSTAAAYCETNADSACAQQAIAWTYLRSKEFHVCPAFFTQVWHGTIDKHTSEAASVVLHELTHCYGTEDYAYGDAGCNRLDASRASNNADSFRLFCMNAIYHLNDKSSGVMKFVNNTNIDFRVEPFKDKVIIRAVEKNSHRQY